jgi:hypothetical protein
LSHPPTVIRAHASDTMKILFIGGPKDGQREEYESPPESVNVAEMQELIIRSHT